MADRGEVFDEKSLQGSEGSGERQQEPAATVQSLKKAPSGRISWDEAKTLALVEAVYVCEAYKVSRTKKADKWSLVRDALYKLDIFRSAGQPCSTSNLMKKYNSLAQKIVKEFSLDSEGANLSGLSDETIPRWKKLIYEMVVEEMAEKSNTAAENGKEQELRNTLNEIETSVLEASAAFISPRTPRKRRRGFETPTSTVSSSSYEDDFEAELLSALHRRKDEATDEKRRQEEQVRLLTLMEAHMAEMKERNELVLARLAAMDSLASSMVEIARIVSAMKDKMQ